MDQVPTEPARVFVALDPPDGVHEALRDWALGAFPPADFRVPDALHVTLAFLGRKPAREVRRAAAIVAALEPRPVAMRLRPGLAPVPPRRPRLFAADADSPAAVALQAELADALADAGLFEPERRPFWPHVTLVRARKRRAGEGRRGPGRRLPKELPAALREPFGAVRVRLYRSILRPSGAEYVPVASLDLPQPSGVAEER
jgi:RNA 2',3'-cyclic 3'-phosphodiesterase